MTEPFFGRTIVASVTPFDENLDLDLTRAQELAERFVEAGVDSIAVCPTTGECPTVFYDDKIRLFEAVLEAVNGRCKTIAYVGDNCTQDTVDFAKKVEPMGFDGYLCVVPYYNKPPQEGLYQHYSAIANAVDVPIMLYNIPGRSVINMTAETTLRLARGMKNVIGIKEASGDIEQMQHILDRRPEGFIVLSGDDGMTLELMRRGGDGVISVAANAFPKRFMECVNYAKAGEFDRAEKAYECLDEAVHALFEEGNPVGVKCALAEMGIIGPTMRLPLVEGSGALREKFRKLIAEYDLR